MGVYLLLIYYSVWWGRIGQHTCVPAIGAPSDERGGNR